MFIVTSIVINYIYIITIKKKNLTRKSDPG